MAPVAAAVVVVIFTHTTTSARLSRRPSDERPKLAAKVFAWERRQKSARALAL
jgi:predicted exporter